MTSKLNVFECILFYESHWWRLPFRETCLIAAAALYLYTRIISITGGCWGFTTVPVTKTIRLSEWVTPGDTAIPGMTSLKDGDLQHSSALAQSSKGDIEPNHPSEINPNSDSRSRSDGRSRRFVQYRVDQSQGQRPRSLLCQAITNFY